METLEGRVAVVTGGASGIGNGMARAFAAEGMKVVLGDIEPEALEKAVDALEAEGASAIGVVCDVSRAADLDALRDRAFAAYGGAHVLCNNAGVGAASGAPSWEVPQSEWDWVMGVNFMGVLHGARSFIPAMIEQGGEGHIVNTASMAGLIGGAGTYGVSKHAVVALSESQFGELAARAPGIGVSVLCPGWVRTRIMESERNRPEAPRATPGEERPEMAFMRKMVEGFIEKGHDPLDVGRLVVEAIKKRSFYVLTHLTWRNMIEHRMQNILQDRPPTGVGPAEINGDWFEVPGG